MSQINNWVHISDRLPNEHEDMRVKFADGTEGYAHFVELGPEISWFWAGYRGSVDHIPVTQWLERPVMYRLGSWTGNAESPIDAWQIANSSTDQPYIDWDTKLHCGWCEMNFGLKHFVEILEEPQNEI